MKRELIIGIMLAVVCGLTAKVVFCAMACGCMPLPWSTKTSGYFSVLLLRSTVSGVYI